MNKANSRSVLFLTELIIAILIFALSMGICGGVFASAFMTATTGTNLNEAVFLSESAAEAFHAHDDIENFASSIGGSPAENGAIVYYDKDWRPQTSPDGALYILNAQISEAGDIVTAEINVSRQGSKSIFDLVTVKNNSLGRQTR
ncbi:MAG: hypothetical protein LBK57_03935 [Clostridiales Family XIII bacterium]|jgi:hypothetical protein|nr:hypothetical protein [Clostridiales Family XIII bacterium]